MAAPSAEAPLWKNAKPSGGISQKKLYASFLSSQLPRSPRCRSLGGRQSLPSYLKDTFTLVRYAETLPLSITRSCSTTSATRKSRSDSPARSTDALAAFSQESVLVPTIRQPCKRSRSW